MVTPGGSDIASLILPPSEPGSYRRPRFLFGEMLEEQIPHEGGRPKPLDDLRVNVQGDAGGARITCRWATTKPVTRCYRYRASTKTL
jgi:hypothetical protein